MHKVFTLLSGGADSTTTLAIARDEFPTDDIECVSIDYGQRHSREMEFAAEQARNFGAEYRIVNIGTLLQGMLVGTQGDDVEKTIPNVSYAELPEGISPTYVSFRN